ncbi:MAG: hypothetical protein LBC79_00860 [Deltaproteobacteria bacterium]|jgi:hypothetical protein|nr:hypothetical protein [Deltaproteobacteria bacterium]
MRAVLCLAALLCFSGAYAFAGTPGIGGEWFFYGNRDATVRIDEASGLLEDVTARTSYVLHEEEAGRHRAVRQRASRPGDARSLFRVHDDLLLFLGGGVKNPILVRKGALFRAPREKIRGRWHYARQLNEAFYYDAEFDLDAGKMVEISRSESGGLTRSAARPLERLLDAQAELALQADGAIYYFTRLGADFLILAPSYADSARNGHKILMERARTARSAQEAQTEKARQADVKSGVARNKVR